MTFRFMPQPPVSVEQCLIVYVDVVRVRDRKEMD